MIPGAEHRSPGICLTAEQYPGKPELGDRLVKNFDCCPRSHGLRKKSFNLVWQCHQLLSVFLAKGHLPRVSLRSRGSLRVILKINYLLSFCYLSPYIPFHQPMQCCNSSGFAKMPLYYRGHLLLRSEMVR